jgi:hypothetical protein
VPPGLLGILDDFWQRPIVSVGEIDGREWAGDVGLPGPDRGKGGKYLVLPPDYKRKTPEGYFTYRCGTYGLFVFWRGFFKNPHELAEPVRVMEQTRIYPLGKKETAKPIAIPRCFGRAGRTCSIRSMARRSTCFRGSSITNTSIPPTCICVTWRRS